MFNSISHSLYQVDHSKIKFISTRRHVTSSIYQTKGVVLKETVVLHHWGSDTPKFDIQQVHKGQNTVKNIAKLMFQTVALFYI